MRFSFTSLATCTADGTLSEAILVGVEESLFCSGGPRTHIFVIRRSASWGRYYSL